MLLMAGIVGSVSQVSHKNMYFRLNLRQQYMLINSAFLVLFLVVCFFVRLSLDGFVLAFLFLLFQLFRFLVNEIYLTLSLSGSLLRLDFFAFIFSGSLIILVLAPDKLLTP